MAGLLHLWNEWEIQILVLTSFALQVFLLSFAWMRRRSISRALRILLWLMYLLAEYTATYTLGHMSIGCKAGEHQQLMAFWAPFLLVHLGGQDTITAYAMEDSQLWLRHLVTFAVQALGAGYVLYKNIGRGPLLASAVVMYLVGMLKNAERVWALSFSRLEMIRRYLDSVSIEQKDGDYPGADCLHPREIHVAQVTSSSDNTQRQAKSDVWNFCLGLLAYFLVSNNPRERTDKKYIVRQQLDDESVLQGAHDLLNICMGQFVDDKIWPSKFQRNAMEYLHVNNKTFELIEMQLSLMYDIFYTKAAVIHTWYGRCFHTISLLGTAMAFFLFQFSAAGKGGYNRVDAAVTYILVTGSIILETASVVRAMGSTWTCTMLKVRKWGWLHKLHLSLRRYVRIAQARRWSAGSTGQLNLLDSYDTASESDITSLATEIISFCTIGSSMSVTDAKELVLEEIRRMVTECQGREEKMWSYRGQCALKRRPDGFLNDLTWSTSMEFDQSILAWHLATEKFLRHLMSSTKIEGPSHSLAEATKAVSNYMMFLLVERPYMLPSPVRPTLHLKARQELQSLTNDSAGVLAPGEKIAHELLSKEPQMLRTREKESKMPAEPKLELLRVVFGVWVEILCYAAHHCSRESHARQLSHGGEFITIVWLLSTAEFNRVYYSQKNFKERKHGSVWNFLNFLDSADFMKSVTDFIKSIASFLKALILHPSYAIFLFIYAIGFCVFFPLFLPFRVMYSICGFPRGSHILRGILCM